MKLSQYDFNKLPNDKKVELASFDGTFLENRFEGEYGINLYSVFGFYAEVWLHRKENEIEKVVTFTQTRYLEPYLKKINIDKIQ